MRHLDEYEVLEYRDGLIHVIIDSLDKLEDKNLSSKLKLLLISKLKIEFEKYYDLIYQEYIEKNEFIGLGCLFNSFLVKMNENIDDHNYKEERDLLKDTNEYLLNTFKKLYGKEKDDDILEGIELDDFDDLCKLDDEKEYFFHEREEIFKQNLKKLNEKPIDFFPDMDDFNI